MIVILSAQYVSESLRSEFGDLPLSFIPLANRRLYVYQVETLRKIFPARPILITLPKDFIISDAELAWMRGFGVEVFVIEGINSLGEELAMVLAQYPLHSHAITFLLGSSLPLQIPLAPDMVGVFETDLESGLPVEAFGIELDTVWAGVFSVSQSDWLADCLYEESNDYFRAIKRYSFKQKVIYSKINNCFNLSNTTCYFHARSFFTTERAFNALKINHIVLKKFSTNSEKIRAEARWFDEAPTDLRKYIPQFLGEGSENQEYFYSIEYLGAIPLNESFVFGRQTIIFWKRIFMKISTFLDTSRLIGSQKYAKGATNEALFIQKAKYRLKDFIQQTGFDADAELVLNNIQLPSLNQILNNVSSYVMTLEDLPAFVHGDLCLSNILYDSRVRAIKLIDPRGIDDNRQQMHCGSQLYEVAKLAHSIIGLYDHIVAGQYTLSIDNYNFSFQIFAAEDVEEIQGAFRRHSFLPGISMRSIEKTLPLLFIAMLSLHSDSAERQKALLANALRLYADAFIREIN